MEPFDESFKGKLEILGLETMFCGSDRYSSRQVSQANGCFRLIFALTSRAAGAISLDQNLSLKDFDVNSRFLRKGFYHSRISGNSPLSGFVSLRLNPDLFSFPFPRHGV